MKKEKDFTFYPSNYKECPICGICSFPHIHKANTNPKDFEKIDEPIQPSKGSVKLTLIVMFIWLKWKNKWKKWR